MIAALPRARPVTALAVALKTVFNFMVVGQVRSGARLVQATLAETGQAACHADLFHEDETVRRACHDDYFGKPGGVGRSPYWFVPGVTNPRRYIAEQVFDNSLAGEAVVGLRLLYAQLDRFELYDFMEERCRAGDFCLVHTVRNPVACLISQLQAEQTGIWQRVVGDQAPEDGYPLAVSLDVERVRAFCRRHEAEYRKVSRACPDVLEVPYHDLLYSFENTMRRVCQFLELRAQPLPPAPICRLRNRDLAHRVANWDRFYAQAPREVRAYLDAEDFV